MKNTTDQVWVVVVCCSLSSPPKNEIWSKYDLIADNENLSKWANFHFEKEQRKWQNRILNVSMELTAVCLQQSNQTLDVIVQTVSAIDLWCIVVSNMNLRHRYSNHLMIAADAALRARYNFINQFIISFFFSPPQLIALRLAIIFFVSLMRAPWRNADRGAINCQLEIKRLCTCDKNVSWSYNELEWLTIKYEYVPLWIKISDQYYYCCNVVIYCVRPQPMRRNR